MASLKDTVISGSLRVTDTIFSTNLNLSSLTASYAVLTDANKNLISRAITDNTSATAVTASTNLITANTLYYHKGNSNIVTVGTITSGTWSATTINPNKGGTGVSSYAKGDILYAGSDIANTATTALSKLALGTAGYTLQATANGPAWAQTVAVANGGTGKTSWTQWGILYASASTTLANTDAGTNGALLNGKGNAAPVWKASANGAVYATAENGDLQWGTLPVAQGGTGQTSIANIQAGKDGDGNTISSTYLKKSGGTMTGELYYNAGTETTNREAYRAYNNSDTSAWWFILRNNTPGTTSAEGFTELLIGNGKNSTTAWNASGKILLYNSNGGGCWILSKYGAINGTNRDYINIAYISCTQIAGTLIGDCTGNATSASKVGTSATWLYFNNSNEVNFGGTGTSTTIYFGYRATDSRPRPTEYIFGASGAYASITCGAISAQSSITAAGTITASAGLLKSTYSSNTVTIGSQNSSFCHIYNSANIPFIFNNTICTISGNLGHSSYPFANLILASGGRVSANGGNLYLGNANNSGWVLVQDICSHTGAGDTYWSARADGTGHFKKVYGAVWNDYAEMRNVPEAQININSVYDDKGEIKRNYPLAGHCVFEVGNGQMHITNKRLQKGCKIISDTFGFCIGETEICKTPIAVTGRVLAYPYESIDEFKNHIGDCVCSGPNGTVSIMNKFECLYYPECIVGIISEIPTYTIWKCGNITNEPIKVNGRIWIYVR